MILFIKEKRYSHRSARPTPNSILHKHNGEVDVTYIPIINSIDSTCNVTGKMNNTTEIVAWKAVIKHKHTTRKKYLTPALQAQTAFFFPTKKVFEKYRIEATEKTAPLFHTQEDMSISKEDKFGSL